MYEREVFNSVSWDFYYLRCSTLTWKFVSMKETANFSFAGLVPLGFCKNVLVLLQYMGRYWAAKPSSKSFLSTYSKAFDYRSLTWAFN